MSRACGLAVMTSLSHSEGRRFKSGQAHLEFGDLDNVKNVPERVSQNVLNFLDFMISWTRTEYLLCSSKLKYIILLEYDLLIQDTKIFHTTHIYYVMHVKFEQEKSWIEEILLSLGAAKYELYENLRIL